MNTSSPFARQLTALCIASLVALAWLWDGGLRSGTPREGLEQKRDTEASAPHDSTTQLERFEEQLASQRVGAALEANDSQLANAPHSNVDADTKLKLELLVRLRSGATSGRKLDPCSLVSVALHAGPPPAPDGKRGDLAAAETRQTRARWNSDNESVEVALSFNLLRDEDLTLSLFVDGLWLASRVRPAGETQIEWVLEPGLYPPLKGGIEILALDAIDGSALQGWVAVQEVAVLEQCPPNVESLLGSAPAIFKDISPGWRHIQVVADDHETVKGSVFLRPGAVVRESVYLRASIQLTGKLSFPNGDPAEIGLAAFSWDGDLGLVGPYVDGCWSRESGEFKFDGLPAGSYLIRSHERLRPEFVHGRSTEDFACASITTDALAGDTKLELVLQPLCSLTLVKAAPQGPPLTWSIADHYGAQIEHGSLKGSTSITLRLARGSYRLRAQDPAGELKLLSLELALQPMSVEL